MRGRDVEVFLDIRVDGKPTPVAVKLTYQHFWLGRAAGAVPTELIGSPNRPLSQRQCRLRPPLVMGATPHTFLYAKPRFSPAGVWSFCYEL